MPASRDGTGLQVFFSCAQWHAYASEHFSHFIFQHSKVFVGSELLSSGSAAEMQPAIVGQNQGDPAMAKSAQAARSKSKNARPSRKRPAQPPPQDPAVTLRIITEQAAFATQIMQRERALAGKAATTSASFSPAELSRPRKDPQGCAISSRFTCLLPWQDMLH